MSTRAKDDHDVAVRVRGRGRRLGISPSSLMPARSGSVFRRIGDIAAASWTRSVGREYRDEANSDCYCEGDAEGQKGGDCDSEEHCVR